MPAIIISASGMATGGRVLHHLQEMLPNRRHTVAIVGFAAEGTRARQLLNGATELKIHGRYIRVRAEVYSLDAFSAHADADELVEWATAAPPPSTCYVIHGEESSSRALADRLRDDAGWTAVGSGSDSETSRRGHCADDCIDRPCATIECTVSDVTITGMQIADATSHLHRAAERRKPIGRITGLPAR
jgi:Cft2 family RNA processing exonuclease